MENKATRLKQTVLPDSSFTQIATVLPGGTALSFHSTLENSISLQMEKSSQGHCQGLKNADAWLFLPFPLSTFTLLQERKAEGLDWLGTRGRMWQLRYRPRQAPLNRGTVGASASL